ncbi:MAG: helix-turn-helix transcriptional regulator [Acidimicrobiales bacterium]
MKEIPDRWTELGEFIKARREDARLSLRRMSEIAGISNPYLSQIERGLRKPSAEILQQIAKALRISAETLYIRAGILDDNRDLHADLVGHILAATDIDDSQKQVLIAVYLSFRGQAEGGPHCHSAPATHAGGEEDDVGDDGDDQAGAGEAAH